MTYFEYAGLGDFNIISFLTYIIMAVRTKIKFIVQQLSTLAI